MTKEAQSLCDFAADHALSVVLLRLGIRWTIHQVQEFRAAMAESREWENWRRVEK